MDVPSFSVPALLNRRNKVIKSLGVYRNRMLDRLRFPEACRILAGVISTKTELTIYDRASANSHMLIAEPELVAAQELYEKRVRAVESILYPHRERRLTDETIRGIGIQVAGMWDALRDGERWEVWDGESEVCSAIYVSNIERMPVPGKMLYKATYNAYAGKIAGITWQGVLPAKYIQVMLHDISNRYVVYDNEDISGMWFSAIIHGNRSSVAFHSICTSSSQKEMNRKLTKARGLACTGPLPPNKGKPCKVCPVGRQACPRARFAAGYLVVGDCVNGHLGNKAQIDSEYCYLCLKNGKIQRPAKA